MNKIEMKFVSIIAAISIGLSAINLFFNNVFWQTVVILIFLSLLYLAIQVRNSYLKRIFYSIAAFVLFEIIIFPLLFSALLSSKSVHYKINLDVNNLRKEEAITDLKNEIDSFSNERLFLTMDSMLSANNLLERPTSILDSQNIFKSGNYLIYKAAKRIPKSNEPRYGQHIYVCNSDGNKLFDLPDLSYDCVTMRDLINKYRNQSKTSLITYRMKYADFDKYNNIWSFKDCILYSISTSRDNLFVPLSKAANLINTVNNFIFYLITAIFMCFLTIPLPNIINEYDSKSDKKLKD